MDRKTKIDKISLCESKGKLKRVRQQAKSKMNEFSIHKIADLHLHVHHHGIPKVPIRGFHQIYDIALQDLSRNPLLLSRTTGKRKICIIKVWRDMDGETEVFYCSVEIILHHQTNSIHDE